MVRLLLVGAALASVATAAPASDKVEQLPGFDKQPFDVYSGFLKVRSGCWQAGAMQCLLHRSPRSRPRH